MNEFISTINKFQSTINSINFNEGEFAIFGTGKFAEKVFKILSDRKCYIKNFYDNDINKQGTILFNLPILDPQFINNSSSTIIIASLFASEIAENLLKQGYKRNLIILDPWYEIIEGHKITDDDLEQLILLNDTLADDLSKDVLKRLITFRTNGLGLIKSDFEQYFHPIIFPTNNDCMVDGGSFDGDVLEMFFDKKIFDIQVHCFEPDKKNYEKLVLNIERLGLNAKANLLGLWEKSCILRFSSSDVILANGCKIENSGDIQISTISIDEYVNLNKIEPTYIKLDVEGAEYETILGAQETIKKYNPKLAISVYHKYNDLWKLPALISSINPKYRFYLGHHTNIWYETVVYAIIED